MSCSSQKTEIDFSTLPIPAEIDDLEDFMERSTFKRLSPTERSKIRPFLDGLLAFPGGDKRAWEVHKVQVRRRCKANPRNSELILLYRELLASGQLEPNLVFESHIKTKIGKSFSGIVSITVVMGPGQFSCPMDCHFCPNDPSIARSYLLKEPAVRRGFQNGWDAYNQFVDRAATLDMCGHVVTKVELLILGGTFGSYPHAYADEFIRDCYFAANVFSGLSDRAPQRLRDRLAQLPRRFSAADGAALPRDRLSLEEEIEVNQYARCAIIGLTLETRPDWISRKELLRFRRYGATRIQLGIQHLDDGILALVNRQCPTAKTVRALRLLKQNCFKVDGHFMPDLPGSSPEQDMAMFSYLFGEENHDVQCDQLKIYPCMTLDHTEILRWYNEGKYRPYAERNGGTELFDLLIWICRNVPYHIRLNRIIRDMPHDYIRGGVNRVNMRQDLQTYLEERGEEPRDIRGREVKAKKFDPDTARLFVDRYRASEGDEYFVSFENVDRTILYGFIRLRLSDDPQKSVYFESLKDAALIRELHVYGVLVHQDEVNKHLHGSQHLGIGRLLMAVAEAIAWERGWSKMAIIAGVGVRDYYVKRGYHLQDTFMVKSLDRFENLEVPPPHFEHHFRTTPTPPIVRNVTPLAPSSLPLATVTPLPPDNSLTSLILHYLFIIVILSIFLCVSYYFYSTILQDF